MDDIKIWIILAQIINFWILLFLFYYFLWDKIVRLIEQRRAKMTMIENLDKDIEIKLKKAAEKAEQIVIDARKRAGIIEKDSMILTTRNRVDMITQAKMEADNILSSARREIQKEKIDMLDMVKEKALDLSLRLNEKVFDTKNVNKEFMEKELKNME